MYGLHGLYGQSAMDGRGEPQPEPGRESQKEQDMPAMSVLAALTISAMGSNYHHQNMVPQRLLATCPRPAANGVVWHQRPAGRDECSSGPARYGASPHDAHDLVYVRVNHQVIAISPWERFEEQGHQKLERARTLWLKERGLVGGVRTHVNAAYDRPSPHAENQPAGAEVLPRAIIHIRERIPANDGPMRAQAAPSPRFTVIAPSTSQVAQADDANNAG